MRMVQGILLGALVLGAVAVGATEVLATAGPAGGMHVASCIDNGVVRPGACSGGGDGG